MAKKKQSETIDDAIAKIEVPLAPVDPDSYISPHVEVRLTQGQALALARLRTALLAQTAIVQSQHSRRLVNSNADVIRWLCERIAEHPT